MSQPSIQWTGNAADPLFPDIKQESYTDTLPEDLFQQNACEESFFLSTNDVFDDFAFPSGGASLDCTGLTTASTPNFSSYSFTTGSSALNTTGTTTNKPTNTQTARSSSAPTQTTLLSPSTHKATTAAAPSATAMSTASPCIPHSSAYKVYTARAQPHPKTRPVDQLDMCVAPARAPHTSVVRSKMLFPMPFRAVRW
jgi:hypothetical protein